MAQAYRPRAFRPSVRNSDFPAFSALFWHATGTRPPNREGFSLILRLMMLKINYLEDGMRLCGFFPPLFGVSGDEIGFLTAFFPFQWAKLAVSESETGRELCPN